VRRQPARDRTAHITAHKAQSTHSTVHSLGTWGRTDSMDLARCSCCGCAAEAPSPASAIAHHVSTLIRAFLVAIHQRGWHTHAAASKP
jgi:hypothetical protein